MLICKDADLELHVLELKDAPRLDALSKACDSFKDEWLYKGTAQVFITEMLARFAANQGFWAGVWVGGEMVGVIGLNNVDNWTRSASFDYMLAASARGKGYMTRAAKALLTYAFDELQLNRIQIANDTRNVKSAAIPERNGFTKEGITRQTIFYGDEFGDTCIYAMLADEWKAKQKPEDKAAK